MERLRDRTGHTQREKEKADGIKEKEWETQRGDGGKGTAGTRVARRVGR